MKSKLEIIEECIEEKTKEYRKAFTQLQDLLNDASSSSFMNAHIIITKFQLQQDVKRLQRELEILEKDYSVLLGDIVEKELIIGSKELVLKYLSQLPDGEYRLLVREREYNGKV